MKKRIHTTSCRWAGRLLFCLTLLLLGLPQQAQADNVDTLTCYVASTNEWNTLAKKYGSEKETAETVYIKIKLCNSLYLTNKSTTWTWFQGEIDGRGYTINVDFPDSDTDDKFVFKNLLNASFANFFIRGTVEFRFGYWSYTYHLPFALKVYDNCTVTFNNCHSYVDFIEASNGNVYKYSYQPTGGFIGHLKRGSTASFTDCSFVGSYRKLKDHDDPWFDTAGFVGGAYYSTVKFRNCLCYITFMEGSRVEDNRTGFFVGHRENVAVSVSNSYCYSPSSIASQITDVYVDTPVSLDQILNGEITYKLNAHRTGDKALWFQTIGTDTVPGIYKWSKEVFLQKKVTRPATTDKWTTLFYPKNLTLPDGTAKYVVTGLKDGKASLSELTISNTADVPMVLHNENGFSQMELPAVYYNKSDQNNLLRATYDASTATATDYLLSGSTFVSGKGQTTTPWQCYIANGSGDGYELETNAQGIYVISSKEAWNFFKENYSGTEVTAYLDCDLTLTQDDKAMENFKGTLDGQGHSIIYDYDDRSTDRDVNGTTLYGFMTNAGGTIKNLNITGKIKTKCLYVGGPLAYMTLNGPLNVENCHSDVDFSTTYGDLKVTTSGGFLARTRTAVSFTDCSFTGSFTSEKLPYTGGFVGQIFENSVTFTNCYSNVQTGEGSALYTSYNIPVTAGYFVGTEQNANTHAYTNCYAHNSGTLDFSKYSDGLTIATDELLTDGTMTEKLNNGRTGDDAPWAQLLSNHKEPQLKTFIGNGDGVRYAAGTIAKDENSHWTTFYYPADVTFTADQGITIYDRFGTDADGNLLIYESLGGTVKAGTPVILYAKNGFTEDITLPSLYYNEADFDGTGGGCLTGVTSATGAATLYTLSENTDGTASIAAAAEGTTLPAWQCYTTDAYAKLIADGVTIRSKDGWNTFKTKYNGQKVNATLACDLELGDDDAGMESFSGTFDGGGHTLTISYTSADDDKLNAPFMTAEGTIKNLNIEGEIKWEGGNETGYCYVAPLVNRLMTKDLELTIDNCHSNVTYTATTDYQKGTSGNRAGGFIRIVGDSGDSHDIKVHFTDCSAIVKLKDICSMFNYGGFVGLVYRGNTATFENCYADVSDNAISKISASILECDYFAVPSSEKAILTAIDCYALKATYANTEFKNYAGVTVVTDDQVASGEVAYKLNAGRTGNDAVWTQTIGTDALPTLKLFANDSKEVHEASGSYTLSATGWGTLYYPTDVTLADGVKAYTVSSVEEKTVDGKTESYVVLTEVSTNNVLSAYTPAILCSLTEGESTATEKTIPLKPLYYNDAKRQEESEDMTAMLHGVLESTEAPDGCYIMQNQDGDVAFYEVDTNVERPTIPAYRCALVWVPKEDQQSSAKVNLRIDDEATGISNILEPLLRDGNVYDLEGRRVQTLQKGHIYIKNGKKFIVR